jgi:ribonuclease-3
MEVLRSVQELQNLIEYDFSSTNLLEIARTRRKFREEITGSNIDENMDPLATVGDAVLDLIVLEKLYDQGLRDVGVLTDKKNKIIDKSRTFDLAKNHHYNEFVLWGIGEFNDKIWLSGYETFDTCIEALIGAVYIDAKRSGKNGIKSIESILLKLGFEFF